MIKEPDAVRRSMGLTGQTATVDELLTGRENLALISALYGLDRPPRDASAATCSSGSRSPTPATGS